MELRTISSTNLCGLTNEIAVMLFPMYLGSKEQVRIFHGRKDYDMLPAMMLLKLQ